MGIRLIAMDLDQTVLNREGKLSETTRRVLEELLEKGICVVPASGRPLAAFPEDVLALKGLEYAIASNGTAIYHLPSDACLARFSLSLQTAEQILGLTKGLPVAHEFYLRGKAWASADYVEHPEKYGAVGKTAEYIRATRSPFEDAGEFVRRHERDLDCMDVVVAQEGLKRKVTEEIVRSCRGIYVTTSDSRLIEVADERAGKHRAMTYLAKRLHIPAAGTAAFGDGDNDAEMLKAAGVGIAMENATVLCREAADYVTLSHEKDGVAWGIRKILGL